MEKLISKVEQVKGNTIISLTYKSSVSEIRKKEQQNVVGGVITKVVTTSAKVGDIYENKCNNSLLREGKKTTFTTGRLSWGKWKVFGKTIVHKGDIYLRYYPFGKQTTTYFVDGVQANAVQLLAIEKIVASKKEFSQKQAEFGIENQVVAKVVKFTNILQMSINGEQWNKPMPMVAE